MSCQFWLSGEPDCSSGFCNISYYFLYVNYIDFNIQLSILVAPLWYTIYWPPGLLYECVWWQFFFLLNLCTETWVSFYVFFCSQEFLLNRIRISSWHCGTCSGRFQLRMRILNWHAHFARFRFGSLFLFYSMSLLLTGTSLFPYAYFKLSLLYLGRYNNACVFQVGLVVPCMRISSWHAHFTRSLSWLTGTSLFPYAHFNLALLYLGR